jgi:branched-chain amino acid transport system ATP-binding protein
MSLLKVKGLKSGYRGVAVIRNVSLSVEPGEIAVLLGSNGAGKTTTLLTISGLLEAISGDVRLDGESLIGRRPENIARAGLIHVPEDRSLFRTLTVAENIRMGARSKADIERVLDYFPVLKPLLTRSASVLSGGEQQMLALARGLAARPKVLLVDEMSLGLAPMIVQRILPVLRQIVTDTGCAAVLVEQHVHLALGIADRADVLARGRIVKQGTAAEVRASVDEITGSYLAAAPSERRSEVSSLPPAAVR